MNIQERLTAFAMLGASWVLWLLVALSVISFAIVLERFFVFIRTRDDLKKLASDVRDLLASGQVDKAKERLAQSPSYEARVAAVGLTEPADGAASAEERLQRETQLVRLDMEQNLVFLGTVGNNAPFVGLLGTVIGIIRSFSALNASAGQVSSELMAEIGEALVATAIGILVAIPAVAFFNVFQRMIKSRIGRADALSRDVLAFLKSERTAKGA